ncbi:hypothetical protein G4B88_028041 [Cannabis sativa]|uniref:Chlorophyllase n=1 Tax=Cannabis sativa TaxID=3483 RepID=A0A7J6HLJ3_CANSA|nr:hypothetical protein G4B88_028041 [Cannabis sativa]
MAGPDTNEEIKSTAQVIDWLSEGLQNLLSQHVKANINKVGLAGHSRGGKTSFALALNIELRKKKNEKVSYALKINERHYPHEIAETEMKNDKVKTEP